MAFISINYNDGGIPDLGYKSVELSYKYLKETKLFNTGDFCQDWFNCMKYLINLIGESLSFSSSVNHFIMDGAPYKLMFLIYENGRFELFDDKEHHGKGIHIFVKDKTKPTWEELKELYGKKLNKFVN